jgi:hypothetical protein
VRTPLLRQLVAIEGSHRALSREPEFDFYRARQVTRLEVDFGDDPDSLPSLRLHVTYFGHERRYSLVLLFEGIRQLLLPEIGPALFLTELEIEDVSDRMMEGIRFQAMSHLDRGFSCACRSIAIVEFVAA